MKLEDLPLAAVFHINGDRLDNRPENLRLVSLAAPAGGECRSCRELIDVTGMLQDALDSGGFVLVLPSLCGACMTQERAAAAAEVASMAKVLEERHG